MLKLTIKCCKRLLANHVIIRKLKLERSYQVRIYTNKKGENSYSAITVVSYQLAIATMKLTITALLFYLSFLLAVSVGAPVLNLDSELNNMPINYK